VTGKPMGHYTKGEGKNFYVKVQRQNQKTSPWVGGKTTAKRDTGVRECSIESFLRGVVKKYIMNHLQNYEG